MKLLKGYALLKQEELDKALKDAEKTGAEKGEKSSKAKIEELEKALARKSKDLEKVTEKHKDELESQADKAASFQNKQARKIEVLESKVEVYEAERDEVREVVKKNIENEDLDAVLTARKETLDAREAKVKDAEAALTTKEDKNYKSGYADGSADMARKIGEITQQDRDNAMKVAMVTAASHTDPRIVKEVTSAYQLTEGTSDKESEESPEDF